MSKSETINESNCINRYWSCPAEDVLNVLGSSIEGLSSDTATKRLKAYGRNVLITSQHGKAVKLFLNRFRNPLILILVIAAFVSVLVHDWVDALIILGIIFISAVLSFIQEYRASHAVEKLRQRVSVKTTIVRSGKIQVCSNEEIVQGDIVKLSAGSLIPGDGILLEAKDFFVSQALLTGETFPVEKNPGVVSESAGLAERSNCVFMGTSVRSGTATALIVNTAKETFYGQIAGKLSLRPPETDFERGLRHFSGLLFRIMVVIVLTVLAANIFLHRSTIDTLLFAMALAIGLSPELLPAILSITLAHGAHEMAKCGVIVRRLNSIENLGSMNVLCTDKTGTLTEGVIHLDGAMDINGQPSEIVMRLAYLNSHFQNGLDNPLDEAVVKVAEAVKLDISNYYKVDEIPYDFVRKRLSVVLSSNNDTQPVLITKGALQNILEICNRFQCGSDVKLLDDSVCSEIQNKYADWSQHGYRVLGVAQAALPQKKRYGRDDENGLVFIGFLLFFDPPADGVQHTLDGLYNMGVNVKIITGDNHLVARHVAEKVGMKDYRTVTGTELATMKDEALWHLAPKVALFAEVDPNQKERIILALQKSGNVVGYLGDGINDAPALHVADVGISVDTAVDVAKEAADLVLLEHDLEVVRKGIDEGRKTFANTIKYIFLTTSANFGNMISMALASLYLPFLPLLAKQILLNNFLSDIPAMCMASDNVDDEWKSAPRRWDIRLLRNYMIIFGLISTVFDILTFGVLLYLLKASPEMFRTGWFVESLLTELLIAMVLRTYKPFYRSRPGRLLLWTTLVVMVVTVFIPFLPVSTIFGFVPLPPTVMIVLGGITVLYVTATEIAKRIMYWRIG